FSNLISTPRGIASSPEGQVYVTNYDGATLVQIDAATGAQQILEFFSSGIGGPLDLGTHPAGVAVSPAAPGTGGFRDVYVSSQGALYRVERTLFDTTSAMTPYPSGHESSNGLFLALYASGVVQGYIGVGQSVLQFNGGTISTLIDLIGEISGLAWMPFSPFVSRANTTCPSSSNGVAEIAYDQFFFQYVAQDFATGGDLACPGALAATPPDAPVPYFYAIDVGSNPLPGPRGVRTRARYVARRRGRARRNRDARDRAAPGARVTRLAWVRGAARAIGRARGQAERVTRFRAGVAPRRAQRRRRVRAPQCPAPARRRSPRRRSLRRRCSPPRG
ncbi:MAG: hypothetical protein H6R20_649, partial [Proteobacteria bacterium]|nr:hypothetical protein [Pseudomonadota bacterium]